MRTLGLAVLVSLVLVGAGCGGSQSKVANNSMRPGGILVSGGKLQPTLPIKARSYSVVRFGCPKKPGTTIAIEACEVKRQLRLDRKFNRTVAALWPLLTPSRQRSFIHSQRSWLAYRRRQCRDVESTAFAGGTEAPVAGGRCLLRLTAERIKDIKATLRLYAPH
jgi:uncharacterized protein YecT (DUF1311 family)